MSLVTVRALKVSAFTSKAILRTVYTCVHTSQRTVANNLRHGLSTTHSITYDKAYVNGQWITARTGDSFQVTNPSDGSVVGSVPDMDAGDAEKAIQAAYDAFQSWKTESPQVRSGVLRRWYELILENQDELAKLISVENGKSLKDAKVEVVYGAEFVDWFSGEARRIYGDTIESPNPNKRIVTIKQPAGVAAMITPWNFPNAMLTRKAAPAIAAGCSVVLKPSEDTPFSALTLCDLAEKAGLPPGVLNVVTSSRDNSGPVAEVLCKHPLVSAISFTGSTAVGKILMKHASEGVKRASMELGGNAPFIVFDSANVHKAATGLLASKFRTSGQACVSPNRILVQEGIHDVFVKVFAKGMDEQLCVGDGLAASTTQGPLINQRAVERVEAMCSDASSKDGNIVRGGKRHSLGGNFFEPTLITNVSSDMLCVQHEIFGPVAPIMKFKTEEEAVAIANATTSGLAGYIFSEDISQCWRVAEKIEFGQVGINEALQQAVEAPLGGFKESGLGCEGSKYGMDEFVEIKYLCFGIEGR